MAVSSRKKGLELTPKENKKLLMGSHVPFKPILAFMMKITLWPWAKIKAIRVMLHKAILVNKVNTTNFALNRS